MAVAVTSPNLGGPVMLGNFFDKKKKSTKRLQTFILFLFRSLTVQSGQKKKICKPGN